VASSRSNGRRDLSGAWNLRYCAPGEGERRGWPASGGAGREAIVASVPGDVHLDLLGVGLINEPLYGRNALDCRWMEGQDWWYSRTFDLADGDLGDRVELLFHGLDTSADIWLNGQHVGAHNNMFVPSTVDVTGPARLGPNLLVVRLDVGLRAVADKPVAYYARAVAGGASVDDTEPWMWMRKAPFTFRWDWATRLLTCGIWRPVELRSYTAVALRDTCLRTALQPDGAARVMALVEVENVAAEEQPTTIDVVLSGPEGRAHEARVDTVLGPGIRTLEATLYVPDPVLWWPAPLGEPTLYDCRVTLTRAGQVLDGASFRYGIREVALLREPLPDPDEGESFTIVVNGRRVYCKGANWVPADALPARITAARYRALVRLAAEAHFNMLRVWGGGIFEDPVFYELCDELGILVWQDFLYACPYYPIDDPAFMAEARREAELAARRLRNHACLALWCGNNEDQWMHHGYATGHGESPRPYYADLLWEGVLPEVCARLDPTRPYWPGSPFGGDEDGDGDPNSEQRGDRHSWGVTLQYPMLEERVDYEGYARDEGKFSSEFGVLSPAPLASLRQFLPPDEIYRGSSSWAFHDNVEERGTIEAALRAYWRPAEDLDLPDYLLYGQVIQGEALAFALEHWRRRAFRTGGSLFWMYDDCWGATSGWTVVDYYLRAKPSYYYVRRAYAPILVSIGPATDGRLSIWIVDDTANGVEGRLEYGLVELPTGHMEQRSMPVEAPEAPGGPARRVAEIDVAGIASADLGRWAAYARLIVDGRVVGRARRFLAGFHFNRLALPPTDIGSRLDGAMLVVVAASYTWGCHIAAPRGVEIEDNYFDLLPGEERRIGLRGPAELFDSVTVAALGNDK